MTTSIPILDLAIGLVFIYFLFSIVMNSFIEAIMSFTKMRAVVLEKWLKEIFDQNLPKAIDAAEKSLGQSIMDHSAVKALSKDGESPSYIDAKNFATALIDRITAVAGDPTNAVADMDGMLERIKTCGYLPDDLKRVFANYAMEVKQTAIKEKGQLELFRNHIENWYDSSMDRLSGEIKRKSRIIAFYTSLVIAVVANIDSIAIAQYLYNNPTARTAFAEKAVAAAKDDKLNADVERIRESKKDSTSAEAKVAMDSVISHYKSTVDAYSKATATLENSSIPMGWGNDLIKWKGDGCVSILDFASKNTVAILLKILGLLITTFAITLGAPFWFDVLSKLSNLRSTGAKPDTAAKKEKAAAK